MKLPITRENIIRAIYELNDAYMYNKSYEIFNANMCEKGFDWSEKDVNEFIASHGKSRAGGSLAPGQYDRAAKIICVSVASSEKFYYNKEYAYSFKTDRNDRFKKWADETNRQLLSYKNDYKTDNPGCSFDEYMIRFRKNPEIIPPVKH